MPLAPAAVAEASVVVCNESGTHTANGPGATATPRYAEWTLSTKLRPCKWTDGSIVFGAMVSSERGMFTCAGGIPGTLAPVPFTIAWSNGKRTEGVLNPYNPGTAPFTLGTGTVTAGELAGAQVVESHSHYVINPAEFAACGSPGGLTRVEHLGVIAFRRV
jgi:hypothetical protein